MSVTATKIKLRKGEMYRKMGEVEKETADKNMKQNKENQKATSENAKKADESKPTEVLDITTMAEYIKLQDELKLAKEAVKESMEMVKSFKQDVDRIKERSERMTEELTEKITIGLAGKVIPILDNFEKSLEHISNENDKKGVEMIFNGLKNALKDMKVYSLELNSGVFDPEKMEAVSAVNAENDDQVGTIHSVVRTGYYYEPTDKVIRYTQVVVYNK